MELLDQVASIVSGVAALGTGVFALWVHRKPKALPSVTRSVDLATYHDEVALAAPQQPKVLAPMLWTGSLALGIGAVIAIAGADLTGVLWLAIAALYAWMAWGTRRERSKTFKSVSFSLRAPTDDVMRRGHDVLKRMGLRILSYDVEAGLIEARRGLNVRTFGERVTVAVSEMGEGLTGVVVESDAEVKSTAFDYGANQRNVDQFVTGVTGLGGDSID